MPSKAVKVRTASTDPEALETLARALEARGLRRRHLLPDIGVITGDAEEDALDSLRAEDGVVSVEEEPGFQAPPFDSDTPQ